MARVRWHQSLRNDVEVLLPSLFLSLSLLQSGDCEIWGSLNSCIARFPVFQSNSLPVRNIEEQSWRIFVVVQRFYHEFSLALVLTLRENRWKISCTFEFRCIGLCATTFCSDDKSDMIAEKRGQRGGGEISNSNVESASARLRSRVGLLNDWIGIEIEAVILFTIALLEIYIYSLHVRMRHWIPRGIANEPTRYFQRIAWHVEEETRARRVKRISFFYFFLSRAKIPLFSLFFPSPPFFFIPSFPFFVPLWFPSYETGTRLTRWRRKVDVWLNASRHVI